jgi:hypothetical protein
LKAEVMKLMMEEEVMMLLMVVVVGVKAEVGV